MVTFLRHNRLYVGREENSTPRKRCKRLYSGRGQPSRRWRDKWLDATREGMDKCQMVSDMMENR